MVTPNSHINPKYYLATLKQSLQLKEQRSIFSLKLDALHRHFIWHSSFGHEDNIYIAEFPKSGGTWLSQLLAELTGLSFPRNSSLRSSQSYILHGHHLSHRRGRKTIHMLRDGRDVMVSAYHYFLLGNAVSPKVQSFWKSKMKGAENFNDVVRNLSPFIQAFHENYKSGYSNKKWADFVNYYDQFADVIIVKYEDLKTDPLTTISHILDQWNIPTTTNETKAAIEKYDFKTQKSQHASNSDFLRKGQVGDWKNYFTEESAKVFDLYGGDALIKAGYEKDQNWY